MANIRLRDLNPARFLNDLEVDGKVGIGTGSSTLTFPLEVVGSIKTSGDLELTSSKMIDWGNGDVRIIEGETQDYSLTFKTYDTNTSVCGPRMKILGDGKIGIGTGTVAPTEMLVLNSASNTRMVVQEAGADKGSIGAGGSGLYIRNLAGAILFRNIADATTMKIFDNGHITFGSHNNVGAQNHSFNPGAGYSQDSCSIALHVPGNDTDRKNWAIRAKSLGGAGNSYLQFRPLDDSGGDYGEGMFYMNHEGTDFSMRSKQGHSCMLQITSPLDHAKIHLDSHQSTAGGSRFTIANDPVVNLFSIYRTPVGGGGEQGTPNLSLRSANAPPASETTGYPGGAGIGTYTLNGGGVTWGNKSRMLKIVGDSDSGNHSVGDEQAGAGIVLYDTDEGNTARSWAIYQKGLTYNSKLVFQYGENTSWGYTKMNYYGTWSYKGGVQQTAWMHWGQTAGNTGVEYLHIKTNLKKAENKMFRFHFEGHAYGVGKIIDSICVGYMHSGYTNSANPGGTQVMNNNGTDTIHIATSLFLNGMYTTSSGDGGYLVVVFKLPANTAYYAGFIGTAVMAAMAGRGFEVVHTDTSLVTHTNEVW
jgi:hypothetical protein